MGLPAGGGVEEDLIGGGGGGAAGEFGGVDAVSEDGNVGRVRGVLDEDVPAEGDLPAQADPAAVPGRARSGVEQRGIADAEGASGPLVEEVLAHLTAPGTSTGAGLKLGHGAGGRGPHGGELKGGPQELVLWCAAAEE